MRIEYHGYGGSLLTQITQENEFKRIDYVFLDDEEFEDVFDEASGLNIVNNSSESWFTVTDLDIVFYLESGV